MQPRSERRRRTRRHALAYAAAVAAGVCGCEAILGMDKHDAHLAGVASSGDGGLADATPDTGAPPCALPSAGDATLRIGNLVPSAARVDICLTRAGGASPVDGQPVLASSSGACPAGLGYKDVTAPFRVASGTYAVALVAAGSGCAASPVASAQVTIAAGAGAGVYLLGDGATAPTTTALTESKPVQEESKLRFVHAVAGLGPLDFGLIDAPTLPAKIVGLAFSGVAFGTEGRAGSSQAGTVDGDGYLEISLLGGTLPVGAAPAGSAQATLLASPQLAPGNSYTAFAIGRPADPSFPEELYVCDEMQQDGPLTRCGTGGSTDVTIDVFDPFLWGPFAPFESLRRAAVLAAIPALPSDVVCVPDVFPDDLVHQIIDAARPQFPYAVHFDDNAATPIADPTTADGAAPVPPSAAPCAGTYDGQLEPFLTCVRDHCSVSLGDDDASVLPVPSACLTTNCTAEAEGLLLGTDLQKHRCWVCALFGLEGNATIADVRTACTTDPKAGLAFGGQSGLLLLSRYPVNGAEQWVMPSTDWRASVLRAPVALPGGKTVDTYCAFLTDPVDSVTVPYTGPWGNGKQDVTAWRAELDLQVQQLVGFVGRKSAGVPAIVAGEFYAGPALPGGVSAYDPDAFAVLNAAFPLAAPASVAPGCTFCASNPITTPPGSTPSSQSTFTLNARLANVPVTDVLAASIELQGAVLDAGAATDAGPYAIPLSTYYDYRATLRIRP